MSVIPVKSYLYPGDEAAIQTVNSIPGLDKLLTFISKNSVERFYDVTLTSSYLKLTEKTAPEIYQMYLRACRRFGVETPPDVFLHRSYSFDAFLFGVESPKILLSSSLLEMLSPQELEVFLASDAAAIKAGHGMIGLLLMAVNTFGNALPLPKSLLTYPLVQWKRQSYYTYDRARLLYCEDYDLTTKLIGYGEVPEDIMEHITLEDRMRQNEEFLQINGGAGAAKALQTLSIARPWNASRMIELYNWVESGAYQSMKEATNGSL